MDNNNNAVSAGGGLRSRSSHPPGADGRQLLSISGPSRSINSMYSAFENFEAQARQKKYMIQECEDTIELYTTQLAELKTENASLESTCEKLEHEAAAYEAKYEIMLKDKEQLEAKYKEVGKELDEKLKRKAHTDAMQEESKLRHDKRIEFLKQTLEQFKETYRTFPGAAALMDKQEENAAKKAELKQLEEELKSAIENKKALISRQAEAWSVFVGKCIEAARVSEELKEKLKIRAKLQFQFDALLPPRPVRYGGDKAAAEVPIPSAPAVLNSQSQSVKSATLPPAQSQGSKPMRSAALRDMEKYFRSSNSPRFGRNWATGGEGRKIVSPRPLSAVRTGSKILAELKARVKGVAPVRAAADQNPPTTIENEPPILLQVQTEKERPTTVQAAVEERDGASNKSGYEGTFKEPVPPAKRAKVPYAGPTGKELGTVAPPPPPPSSYVDSGYGGLPEKSSALVPFSSSQEGPRQGSQGLSQAPSYQAPPPSTQDVSAKLNQLAQGDNFNGAMTQDNMMDVDSLSQTQFGAPYTCVPSPPSLPAPLQTQSAMDQNQFGFGADFGNTRSADPPSPFGMGMFGGGETSSGSSVPQPSPNGFLNSFFGF